MSDKLITTVDNPYDPHTQFNDWYYWDMFSGCYNSLGLIAWRVDERLEELHIDYDSATDQQLSEFYTVACEELIELYGDCFMLV